VTRSATRLVALVFSLAALTVVWLQVTPTQDSSHGVALTHVTIVNTTGSPAASDMSVVILGQRIIAVGETSETVIPPDTDVIDASGKFLIPGLWDMHVHSFKSKSAGSIFAAFLANGVLGVRDMGSSPPSLSEIPRLRAELASGALIGPRLVAAGPMIDGAQPMFPDVSIEAANEIEARQAVSSIAEAGADFIKVYTLLPRDAYFAIADESRRRGLVFAGHVPDSITAAEASDAGQKSIEHLSGVWLGCSSMEDELRKRLITARASNDPSVVYRALRSLETEGVKTYDRDKARRLFRRFTDNGTWQVPTLITTGAVSSIDARSLARAMGSRHGKTRSAIFNFRNLADDSQSVYDNGESRLFELVREMHEAGVGFMAGTDTPNLVAAPGVSLHTELELLVRAGFTPMEALQTATIKPAEYLGLQDQLGTVEVGKIADLVLLDADPLTNISNSRLIAGVLLRGRLLLKSELDEQLAKAGRAPGVDTQFSVSGFGVRVIYENQVSRQTPPKPSIEEIREAEQRLSDLGYWTGPIDGAADAGFRHALIAFQKVEGRARTGKFTLEELQALRVAKRPIPLEAGPFHAEIDLTRQVLFVVNKEGTVEGILPVSTGNNRWFTSNEWTRRACTPCGRFKIHRKVSGWRKSELGLMYYPNYILGGVAIHGSKSVPAYPASHGCIRIPMYAAKEFSETTPIGTPVIVHAGTPQP
jgi:imidazolonepropionase-like amidohydrolase